MRKLLLIILLIFLSACVDTDKISSSIENIKEENNEADKRIRELVDSLHSIANAQNDTVLCNALNDIADDIEFRLDDYSIEWMLEDLKKDLYY